MVRLIVPITAAGAEIGTGSTEATNFQTWEPRQIMSRRAADVSKVNFLVQIGRQPAGWFVDIDGQRLGAIPTAPGDSEHVFLRANNGVARFSDIQVVQTKPKQPEVR